MMETIKDIIAEMRKRSDEVYAGQAGYPECWKNQMDYDEIDELADRIEKAVTDGSQLKMREALTEIQAIITVYNKGIVSAQTTTGTIEEIIEQALASAPRNCDLYTNRHDAWWDFRNERKDLRWEDSHLEFPDWLFAEAKGDMKK